MQCKASVHSEDYRCVAGWHRFDTISFNHFLCSPDCTLSLFFLLVWFGLLGCFFGGGGFHCCCLGSEIGQKLEAV